MLGRFVEHVRYTRVSKATAALLEKTGWNIFSPITHSHVIPRWIPERLNTHTFWLGLDFDWISACDEVWVFMQPGWRESYGVAEELKLAAHKLSKPIRYVDMKYRFVDPDYGHTGDLHNPPFYPLPKD